MKAEEREALLDLVEGLVVRGYNRPGEIAKNLGLSRNTAARYLRIVLRRITTRTTAEQRDATRSVAIEAAREAMRRAWASYASASNSDNVAAAVGALRVALQAQERIAKLNGLDIDRHEFRFDQSELDADTDRILQTQPIRNAPTSAVAAVRFGE